MELKTYVSIKINSLLKSVLNKDDYTTLKSKILKRSRISEQQLLIDKHKDIYGSTEITIDDLQQFVFSSYYNGIDINKFTPEFNCPVVSSYVPYTGNSTNIIFHNYFSHNYGIRDPILVRVSVIKFNTSLPEVIYTHQILVPTNNPLLWNDHIINDKDEIPNGILILEAFHKNIQVPSDQIRFHVFYTDSQKVILSTVHALPYQKSDLATNTFPQVRSASHVMDSLYYCTPKEYKKLSPAKSEMKFSHFKLPDSLASYGYLISLNKNKIPKGIWHDQYPSFVSRIDQEKSGKNVEASVFVPESFPHPILHIHEGDVGWNVKCVKISLYSLENLLFDSKLLEIIESETFIDLEEYFDEKILMHRYFVIDFMVDWFDFQYRPRAMINVRYRAKNGFADQIHSNDQSHYSTGYVSHEQQNSRHLRSRRCKKFAPFLTYENIKNLIVLNNRFGMIEKKEDWINIRLFTDQGSEFVINRYPVKLNGFTVIDEEIIREVIQGHVSSVASLFLEQPFINLTANFFFIDNSNGVLAGDHFTGG